MGFWKNNQARGAFALAQSALKKGNVEKAKSLFTEAAELGHEEAKAELRKLTSSAITPPIQTSAKPEIPAEKTAGQYLAEATKLIDAGRRGDALEPLTKAAEMGSAAAKTMLSVMFPKAADTPAVSESAAVRFFNEAEALKSAGRIAEALTMYQKAADLGHAHSIYMLDVLTPKQPANAPEPVPAQPVKTEAAVLFDKGVKLCKAGQAAEAMKFLRKAAELGDADASNMIGFLYARGDGVTQNIRTAAEWFDKAVKQGNKQAVETLEYTNKIIAEWDEKHKKKEQDESAPQSVAKNESAQPVKTYNVASDDNSDTASLAKKGQELYKAKQYTEAMNYCKKAAELGDAGAMLIIGYMYSAGEGVEQDKKKTAHWFEKAAETGDLDTMFSVGLMYKEARSVERNLGRAAYWFEKSAEKGHVSPMYHLAYMYQNGDGVTKDISKAAHWFEKAAEKGHVNALMNIAYMYSTGEGVEKNLEKAVYWSTKAKNAGVKKAALLLEQLQAAQPAAAPENIKSAGKKTKKTKVLVTYIKKRGDRANCKRVLESRGYNAIVVYSDKIDNIRNLCFKHMPDVIVCDADLYDRDGRNWGHIDSLLRAIDHPNLVIIIASHTMRMYVENEYVNNIRKFLDVDRTDKRIRDVITTTSDMDTLAESIDRSLHSNWQHWTREKYDWAISEYRAKNRQERHKRVFLLCPGYESFSLKSCVDLLENQGYEPISKDYKLAHLIPNTFKIYDHGIGLAVLPTQLTITSYLQSRYSGYIPEWGTTDLHIDGFSILQQIRSRDKDVEVIFWSLSDDPVYRARAAELGAKGFLVRPFTSQDLFAEVKKALSAMTPATHAEAEAKYRRN